MRSRSPGGPPGGAPSPPGRGTARGRLFLLLLGALLLFPHPSDAQFGRNRVRHEPQDFRLLRTAHIDLYHPPELQEVALRAARLAESIYGRLARVLQHDFRDRIPVVLYGGQDRFQQANALPGPVDESTGGVTEFFKRRVILPFTGSWPDFEHVLAHELVHAFQLDILYGAAPPEALIHGVRPPLWFLEGMAEYLSVGPDDPRTRAWVRDGILTGYLPDLATLGREGGYLSYRYGQSFWTFLADRWGEAVVGEILHRVPRLGLEGAVAAATGRDLETLGALWTAAVRQEVLTGLVAGGAAAGGSEVTVLNGREAPGDPWSLAPALSPDGRRVAHLSTRGGESFDLWLSDAETGRMLRRLARGGRSPDLESLRFMTSAPAFSPDGERVAVTARSGSGEVLILLDATTGRSVRRIELPLRSAEAPTWSPDGRSLALSGTRNGASALWRVELEDGSVSLLHAGEEGAQQPAWSPDGGRIAFVLASGRAPGSVRQIALLELETGRVEVLPGQHGAANVSPVWSPDGRHLALVSDGGGMPELHLYDLERGVQERVVGAPAPLMGLTPSSPVLSWSAAGPLLLVRFRRAGYELVRLEAPLLAARESISPLPQLRVGADEPPVVDRDGVPGVDALAGPPGDPGRSLRDESLRRAIREGRSTRTLQALLDSAAVVLPDTVSVEALPVRTRLTPDMALRPTLGAQVGGVRGSGVYGGTAVLLSDMLGNHRLLLATSLNGSLRDAAAEVRWVWSRYRWDLVVALEQAPLYRWVSSSAAEGGRGRGWEDVYLREVARRGTVGIRHPLSTFRRVEVAVAAGHEDRDLLRVGVGPDGRAFRTRSPGEGAGYLQGSLAWVHDDTRWGWSGPVGGSRARVEFLRSGLGIRYDQWRGDLRGYARVGQGPVVAGRLHGVVRQGPDADLRTAYWGGPWGIRGWSGGSFGGSGSPECLESREAVEDGALSPCPARDRLVGSSGVVASGEVRLPLSREIQVGSLGSLPPLELLLFGDAGLAWSRRVCRDGRLGLGGEHCPDGLPVERALTGRPGGDPFLHRHPVGSWGAGVRLNLLVVQLEVHHARPLDRPGRGGVWGVVLGPPF